MLATLLCTGLLTMTAAQAADDAIFQGLGGKPGIRKIVDALIPIVLADPRIEDSFADINMKHHQRPIQRTG